MLLTDKYIGIAVNIFGLHLRKLDESGFLYNNPCEWVVKLSVTYMVSEIKGEIIMFQDMLAMSSGGGGGSITYQRVTVTTTPVTIKIKNGVYKNIHPNYYCYCDGYVIDGVNTIERQAPAFTVSYNTTTNELTMSTNSSYDMEFFIIE